jgi:hypothetical protein
MSRERGPRAKRIIGTGVPGTGAPGKSIHTAYQQNWGPQWFWKQDWQFLGNRTPILPRSSKALPGHGPKRHTEQCSVPTTEEVCNGFHWLPWSYSMHLLLSATSLPSTTAAQQRWRTWSSHTPHRDQVAGLFCLSWTLMLLHTCRVLNHSLSEHIEAVIIKQ